MFSDSSDKKRHGLAANDSKRRRTPKTTKEELHNARAHLGLGDFGWAAGEFFIGLLAFPSFYDSADCSCRF